MQLRRFGSKIGGGRNGLGGCALEVGDKVCRRCHSFENGVQNNAASGASRIFWGFYPKLWHFWGTLVANEVRKLWNIFVFKAKGSSCPLLAMVPGQKCGGQTTLRSPHPKFVPLSPVIYAPDLNVLPTPTAACLRSSSSSLFVIRRTRLTTVSDHAFTVAENVWNSCHSTLHQLRVGAELAEVTSWEPEPRWAQWWAKVN